MRIQVRRTGGFAGIERLAEVETDGRADAGEVQSLAERAMAEGRETPPVGVPDGFTYQITVDGRTVYCADPRLSEAQRDLISLVLKEGS
ncbi:protealysin inhibitor emfourin [Streptomyces sp. NPDC015127]|uniref:protealysin inhibitor emfourin n=1 Tax=Streptomyces sp. NPDC015127 TaxID=3364939 RepID=UPI0036F9664A